MLLERQYDPGFWQRCGESGSSSGESRSFCAKANSTCQAPKITHDCFMETKTNKNITTEPSTRKMTNLVSKTKTKPKIKKIPSEMEVAPRYNC